MLLKLKLDLSPLKTEARERIDAMAENLRSRFISTGAGQALVYAEKEREAEQVSANPAINPALVPHISHEADQFDVSLLDAAVAVLIKANEWRNISPRIERARLQAKESIDQSQSPLQIDRAVAEFNSFCDAF